MSRRCRPNPETTGFIIRSFDRLFNKEHVMSQTRTSTRDAHSTLSVAPNLFSLSGGGLHISYSTSSFGGKAQFTYRDELRTVSFQGDEIRVVPDTDIGTIVSVTIVLTPDAGSTTFSLLLPRVNLPGPGTNVSISAEGITTHHAFSIAPALDHGQRDFYRVKALHGTASNVNF
jgi:hypothetical protein